MGGTSFEVHQPGSDLNAAFEAARESAAYRQGWRNDNGTITTKTRVVIVHEQALPLASAKELARKLLDRFDQPYCDHYGDIAAAIPVADVNGAIPDSWLLFGVANE